MYCLSFFQIIGGLVVYYKLRKSDATTARNLLLVGIALSLDIGGHLLMGHHQEIKSEIGKFLAQHHAMETHTLLLSTFLKANPSLTFSLFLQVYILQTDDNVKV